MQNAIVWDKKGDLVRARVTSCPKILPLLVFFTRYLDTLAVQVNNVHSKNAIHATAIFEWKILNRNNDILHVPTTKNEFISFLCRAYCSCFGHTTHLELFVSQKCLCIHFIEIQSQHLLARMVFSLCLYLQTTPKRSLFLWICNFNMKKKKKKNYRIWWLQNDQVLPSHSTKAMAWLKFIL